LEEMGKFLHGPEEIPDILQKGKSIVPAGCAEPNLMTVFRIPMKKELRQPGIRWNRSSRV
jgi:hypothetical protein